MKICMLSGPVLGHIGRLYEIAVAIRARSNIDIHFVIPAQGDYAARLLDGKFTYTLIPLEGVDRLFRARSFAEGFGAHCLGGRKQKGSTEAEGFR